MRSLTRRQVAASVAAAALAIGIAAPAVVEASTPSGEALVFGVIAQDSGPAGSPATADGIEAWAWHVNQAGGIDGRPVEIIRCDDAANGERNQSCARDLINDEGVVGIIGGSTRQNGPVSIPLLAEAGVGYVCSAPLTAAELSAENALCVSGGALAEYAGLTKYFIEHNRPNLAFVRIDAETGVGVAALLDNLASSLGGALVADVAVAAGTPDLYPAATAALAEDPDVILVGTAPADTIGLAEALSSIGTDVPFALVGTSLTDEQAELAGSTIDGAYVATGFPTTIADEDETTALSTALQESAGVEVASGGNISGWAAGRATEAIVEGIGADNVTRESFLEYLTTTDLPASALFPNGLSRSLGEEIDFPALANRGVYIGNYDAEGGIETTETEPIDGFG